MKNKSKASYTQKLYLNVEKQLKKLAKIPCAKSLKHFNDANELVSKIVRTPGVTRNQGNRMLKIYRHVCTRKGR